VWPWEHVAFGYLCYAGVARVRRWRPPTDAAAVWLVVGTQFPDLVDKPLAWSLGVLPSGTTLAHSAFVALPMAAVAVLVGRRFDRPAAGAAFAVGYLSHLPADVLYPALLGRDLAVGAVLWPLVGTRYRPPVGFGVRFQALLGELLARLAGPAGPLYLAGEAGLLGLALLVWLADGAPGLGYLRAAVRAPRPTRDE